MGLSQWWYAYSPARNWFVSVWSRDPVSSVTTVDEGFWVRLSVLRQPPFCHWALLCLYVTPGAAACILLSAWSRSQDMGHGKVERWKEAGSMMTWVSPLKPCLLNASGLPVIWINEFLIFKSIDWGIFVTCSQRHLSWCRTGVAVIGLPSQHAVFTPSTAEEEQDKTRGSKVFRVQFTR